MNSLTCDRCGKQTEPHAVFDFCWTCGADLCESCLNEGCCDRKPGRSGTKYANGLYRLFGSNPPSYAQGIEFD
jgi:predicted amidophosphoribosyltransferase